MTSESYPTDHAGATASLGMAYDSMGRLNTLTDNLASSNIISSASYGAANELLKPVGNSRHNGRPCRQFAFLAEGHGLLWRCRVHREAGGRRRGRTTP